VPALPRAGARSHFRPIRDGVAIGSFLAGRVLSRWAREARVLGGEIVAVFHADRMAERHSAMLEAAAGYADSPARWTAAIGAMALRRAGARIGAVCEGARQRGTAAAALATLTAPLALPLVLAQAVLGEWLPDVVSPLVEAVYGTRRTAWARTLDVSVGADAMTETGG
jgi:hypothetical protein